MRQAYWQPSLVCGVVTVDSLEGMNNRGVVVSGLVRALTAVWLLGGVLAMHALTVNHDSAMMAMPAASVVMSSAGAHDEMPVHVTVEPDRAPAGPTLASTGGHHLGEVCVAVLAVSLMLLGLALTCAWLRSARSAPWLPGVLPVQLSLLPGRSPPWLTPSLSKLCVLRT